MLSAPLSGGYAGAKATVRFISAYAEAEAKARSKPVADVTTGDGYSAAAYFLTATELRPWNEVTLQ